VTVAEPVLLPVFWLVFLLLLVGFSSSRFLFSFSAMELLLLSVLQ
jgi:hypothetical protein